MGFCLPRRAGGIRRPSLAQGDLTASISQKGADAQSLSSCQLPGQIRVGTCARFKPGTGGFVAPPRKVAGCPHLARQQLSARLLPVGDSAENALAVVAAVLFSRPAGTGYWRGSGRRARTPSLLPGHLGLSFEQATRSVSDPGRGRAKQSPRPPFASALCHRAKLASLWREGKEAALDWTCKAGRDQNPRFA